jgi:hypothetical protein
MTLWLTVGERGRVRKIASIRLEDISGLELKDVIDRH